MKMNVEERIKILLRAATRAEGEGELRVATVLRRMADEARSSDLGHLTGRPRLGCCTE